MISDPVKHAHRHFGEPRSGAGGHVRREDVFGVSVEILAGSVVAHGGARVRVAGGDLYVSEVDSSVEHRGDVGVPEHVRMHPWELDSCLFGEAL